jgi:hypothetical protein
LSLAFDMALDVALDAAEVWRAIRAGGVGRVQDTHSTTQPFSSPMDDFTISGNVAP